MSCYLKKIFRERFCVTETFLKNLVFLFFMKKWMMFVFMFFILSVSFSVDAAKAEIVVVDDVGSFTGAVLRVISPITEEVGDKIYPSAYLTQAGVVKFDIETSLDEVNLKIVISKDGHIVGTIEDGPFAVNGSRILFDRRDGVNRSFVAETPVVEEVNETPVVSENNSNGTEVVEPIVVEDVAENNILVTEVANVFLTGKSVFIREDGTFRAGSSFGGMLLILMLVIFVFMGHNRVRYKKKTEEILSDDDKELAYMEKKIKDTENKISKIKGNKERQAKVESIKAKLSKEEKELHDLEKEEAQDSEKVEDL